MNTTIKWTKQGERVLVLPNGKEIKIVDANGTLVGTITKLEVNYSYLSNYDPRYKVEA